MYVGGLTGANLPGSEIINSYWNNNTSGQTSSEGGESKGSVAMKQQVTYKDWDFDRVWDIDLVQPYAFNDGYPFLRWQVDAEFAGGSGTLEDPYLITTEDQLNNVRNHLDKDFRQTADLDLSGYRSGSGWAPIGTSANPFIGTYDGDGHIIDNLFIEQEGVMYSYVPAGLFGYTGAEAEIRDLTLEDVDVTGCYYVGSLVGNNSGKITNVSVSGNVTGEWDTGGLVGLNRGTISLTTFTGAVTGADEIEYGDWTGGLVGYNLGAITDCRAYATVIGEGDNVGGLVGENLTGGIITESCSAGDVTAYDYSGGLAGANSGEITSCYSLCTVNGDSDVGGLVGGNSGSITDSFAAGTVEGTYDAGGLVGSSTDATVTGCYWDIEASSQSTSAGGTGKTTADMKQQATFTDWDFIAIWDINTSFNNGYPFLRWQDDLPPVLSETGADSLTDTTAALSFSSDKSGIYYCLVYEAAEDAPDAAAIKAQGEAAAKGSGTAAAAANNAATGLTNGTEYSFKVRAVNNIGNGAEASVTATPTATQAPTYAVTVTNGTGGGEFAQGVTVTITANPAPAGQRFKEWQVISGGITLVNSQEASTSFQMPANAVEVAATYETIPETTYTVTVNGSYAAKTGAGSYAQGATVTISAGSRSSYTFAGWTSPDGVTFMNANNATTTFTMPNGRYDPATGMVTFDTTHFSDYAVVYNKVSFNDVTADAWYHKAVSFIAARGITGGTGNGNYSPEVKLTRGQFIVMLMKAYGIAPDADPKNNFADAKATYYTGYLAAAKRLSISNGVGNNMFAPEKEITRQEMFTLLYNALKAIGRLPEGTAGKPLSTFADAENIASWAKEAMTLLVETGTISGNGGKLSPMSTTTRAEMAQVLYNLLSK